MNPLQQSSRNINDISVMQNKGWCKNVMRSIKWKLIAMYLGLVLIVMIVSGTYILLSLQNIEIDKSRSQLEQYAEKISEQVVKSYEESGFQKGLEDFSRGNSNTQIQGSILNSIGETIATTAATNPPYPEFKSSGVISAMAGISSFRTGEKDTDAFDLVKQWMSYSYPVEMNGEVKYIVYTRISADSMQKSLDQTKKTIVVAVFLAFFLTIIMGYIFAKTLTDPILILTARAKEMAEGMLNQKIKVQSADEIGQLTLSFNDMASKLNKTLSEMGREKNKLEVILHNMTDGVISFDKDGNLLHINSAGLEMLEIEEDGWNFSRFIKEFDINSSIYLDMGPEFTKQAVFPVGNKFINASFSPYTNEKRELEGLVVVLRDITEQKKLDDMRKEFVANVSHELRTPLTTVKSYTETLMDGAIEDKEIAVEFLGIIDSEADRMAFLVRDLLQLSRFDNKQIMLNYTQIAVNEFLAENVRQSKIHAENKRQNLYFIPFDHEIYLMADRDRVTQVMNNLITNAIKYSLQGAEIKVYVEEESLYYKIIVKDTGMGISREDLPRIFERFYRVDKARSRAMGGTGLGLAIAKEIMETHGGKITVESEYGKGTKMTLWFLKEAEMHKIENNKES